MHRIVAGGTGLIGTALVKNWLAMGHEITVIGRSIPKIHNVFGSSVKAVSWATLAAEDLAGAEAIINLSGTGIADHLWTKTYKHQILTSRIETTQTLVSLCQRLGTLSPRLFNTSAIGIYGLQDPAEQHTQPVFTELDSLTCSNHPDFLAQIAQQWEQLLAPAQAAGIATVIMRFGVVLAKQGGMLAKLLPTYRLGLGAKLGSGKQIISWVSLTDVVAAINFLLEEPTRNGIFNFVAPQCVTQVQFAKTLSSVLNRPCLLHLPAWLLKLLLGEMAEVLLKGQAVQATNLKALGFHFTHPTLHNALQQILGQQSDV